MPQLLFIALANTLMFASLFALSLFLPFLSQLKSIDLLFLTGLGLWTVAIAFHLGGRSMKKKWQEQQDPNVMTDESRSDQRVHRFLIAGGVSIAATVIWGFFY